MELERAEGEAERPTRPGGMASTATGRCDVLHEAVLKAEAACVTEHLPPLVERLLAAVSHLPCVVHLWWWWMWWWWWRRGEKDLWFSLVRQTREEEEEERGRGRDRASIEREEERQRRRKRERKRSSPSNAPPYPPQTP